MLTHCGIYKNISTQYFIHRNNLVARLHVDLSIPLYLSADKTRLGPVAINIYGCLVGCTDKGFGVVVVHPLTAYDILKCSVSHYHIKYQSCRLKDRYNE